MMNLNIPIIVLLIMLLALVIIGAVLIIVFTQQKQSQRLQNQFGTEYDHTVKALGDEKKAQVELEARNKHVEALEIHPLTTDQRERYLVNWAEVQSKFVDEPGQAIVEADHLIMEVMQMRAYPVADFEQRAADLSVTYPSLVSNYRSARLIALKNEKQSADTEELRQALIYYRSLFEELLETSPVVA